LRVKLNRVVERLPDGSISICNLECLDDSNVGKYRRLQLMLYYSTLIGFDRVFML
jgi:hypothetical protein